MSDQIWGNSPLSTRRLAAAAEVQKRRRWCSRPLLLPVERPTTCTDATTSVLHVSHQRTTMHAIRLGMEEVSPLEKILYRGRQRRDRPDPVATSATSSRTRAHA